MDDFIWLAAFRYCLGRRSYAPSLFVSEFENEIKKLGTILLNKIYDEIERAEDTIEMPIWIELKGTINEELFTRRKRITGCRNYICGHCKKLKKECMFDDAETESVPCVGYFHRDNISDNTV